MALEDIFTLIQADKYSDEGREEILKAQAATEDARRTYQIGEISEKTGLQKTANGWVEPKNRKQPGAKEPDESARIAASKEARAKKSQELEQKAAGDFAKYKDLPPVQRKDALGAASHEGISIGMTQRSMEGMGWNLIQADNNVNVYGKPDGSKAIMKHDGKKITEVSYEGPESKLAGNKPNYQITEKDGKYYATGHQFSDGSQLHAGPFGSEEEVHKFMNNGVPYRTSKDSAPRILTGDTKIRVRKD